MEDNGAASPNDATSMATTQLHANDQELVGLSATPKGECTQQDRDHGCLFSR